MDYKDGFVRKVAADSPEACCGACRALREDHGRAGQGKHCGVAVFVTGSKECFLKASTANAVNATGRVSCQPT